MAYIGNTVENQGFTPAIDYFNGNGVTVTFTLSRPIASVAQVIVAVDNVIQNPNSAFTVAGNAITFSSAPLSGTNNIWVEYTSLITTYQAISQDPTVIGDIRATGGYLAEGDFGNSFVDGAILDYVTGLGRITVGDADGLAIYNGGTASRTALMTVGATGNVGIGTTSPTSLGGTTLQVQNSTVGAILWSDGTRTGELLASAAANVTVGSRSNHSLQFVTNDTARMSIDTSGNIGASNAIMTIGDNSRTASSSTTTGAIVCGGGLGVWSNINAGGGATFGDAVQIFNNPTSSAQGILFRNTFNVGASIFSMGAATTNGIIAFVGGNGTQGGINGNGAGISYTSASDYRLKENVAPMTGALAKVAQLKPCTYIWKCDGSDGQGFIAHELQEVFPDAVHGEKDAVDEDGNIQPQGVDTSFLVATLTAAIQEQQAMIEELKIKVAALEAR
jgi:hypothetical protein